VIRATRRNLPLLGAAAIAVLAVMLLAWAFSWRSMNQERLCTEIEKLKTEFRAEANESVEEAERNLRLLNIPFTPELLQSIKETRDRKLRRFAAKEC
jgi:Tfp pilus assembly protein PilO